MIICDNCGEPITHVGDGEITCDICGVVQQRFSQTVIEEFSSSYTQTQKIGRLKPAEPTVNEASTLDEDDESRDFHFIVGIQMVLDNLCKTLVKSFAFSNQVEVEAKNIWARYLTFVVENDIPISNMFCDPLTRGNKYYVDSQYLKNSFQVPTDVETLNIPKRMHKVIRDMGKTSFEYTTMLCINRVGPQKVGESSELNSSWDDSGEHTGSPGRHSGDRHPTPRKRSKLYDYTDVKAYLENSDQPSIFSDDFETGVELPRSRRCSPIGFPIYMLEDMLMQRQIPSSPLVRNVTGFLEPSNPYRLSYMMNSLYRHDFLWRLLYAYPHLDPLEGFKVSLQTYGSIANHEILFAIEEHPLEWSDLSDIADSIGIRHISKLSNFRHCEVRRLRIDLINEIYVRIADAYFKGRFDPEKTSNSISWIVPRMDLHLVCCILFVALLKCRYAVVMSDIVRWVVQGRLPLRRSASVLPDSILRAAFREGKLAPRMQFVWSKQEESAYNLFTNTRAPHSSRYLESLTSRLLISGILDDEDSGVELTFNVHGLCRRIVHHLRLPSNVLPVADMIISRVTTEKSRTQGDEYIYGNESRSMLVGRMGIIYGTGLNGYPLHVLAAASVLSACRMLWPVFHFNTPAYPCRTAPPDSRNDYTMPTVDDTSETHIIKQDRFPQAIEFDPDHMRWIVRLPVRFKGDSDIAARGHASIAGDAGFDPHWRDFMLKIGKTMHDEVNIKPLETTQLGRFKNDHDIGIYQSLCESMSFFVDSTPPDFLKLPDETLEGAIRNVHFFNARSSGYITAGISALLWLLHHQPSSAIRACSAYHTPCDILELRRIVASNFLYREPSAMVSTVTWQYLNTLSLTPADHSVLFPLQNPKSCNLWLNMAGLWSGSVVNCIGLQESDLELAKRRAAVLSSHRVGGASASHNASVSSLARSIAVLSTCVENEDNVTEFTASMPGNREVYYTVTELFGGYPYYSGWSPEKSLEFDSYWFW